MTLIILVQHNFQGVASNAERTDVKVIGRALLSTEKYGYALPFEVISILLLASMVGAIILAKKRKD
jgi:NADH-quinone oxidoreductase subunit J